MVENEKLLDVVSSEMASLIKNEPHIRFMAEGDEETTKNLILSLGEVRVDKPYKVRLHFETKIGYGYDFIVKTKMGLTPREIYDEALKRTKLVMDMQNTETLIADGISENRFGWYITKIG